MILTDTPVIEEKKRKEEERIIKEMQKSKKAKELCEDNTDYSDEPEEVSLEIRPNDFVIVRYPLKKRIKYYVGQVEKVEAGEFFINFLKKTSSDKFLFPEKKDEDIVYKEDIIVKLPIPFVSGGTERAAKQCCFAYDFSPYNIE